MAYHDQDMPDELQDGRVRASSEAIERDDSLLEALGITVGRMRDEAVAARKSSGIEEVWMACEEAYLGIDDANRHEFASAKWAKPTSMEGSVTTAGRPNSNKSTAFVRLTSRYVDMGAAKISEITLPIDDKAFTLDPTPVPEMVEAKDDQSPLLDPQGQQVFRAPKEGEQPGANGMVPATKADQAGLQLATAKDCATKAETRIYDWMLEANYPAEMRKVIHEAARLGAGVLKSPFPQVKTSYARKNGKLKHSRTMSPGMKQTSVWNIYPDPACGESIHNGDFLFECDKLSAQKLKKLKLEKLKDGTPIYIHSQIDKVLEEGPGKCKLDGGNPHNNTKNQKQFQIWYFTGVIKRAEMVLMGAVGIDDLPDDVVDVSAIVTLVNDSVIRATINPLESGSFPYRVLNWSRREGSWAGVGVSEQVAMPQRMVNASTRALLNNAGKSAGAQTVMDQNAVVPADGKWEMTPDKLWWLAPNAVTDDVRKIFMSIALPNMGPQLMAIIQYAFKLAEEASNIPLVAQGRDSENTPATFGAAELQNNNAHTLLRSLAYQIDDDITEPVVRDLYEWLLLDEDVPEDEKGDFKINAKGSIAMVEKAVQEMVLSQLLPASKDPAFGMNPKKVAEQYLMAKRLDPRKLQYTEEEQAEMAKQPQPEAPVITAAKIRSASAEKIAVGRDQVTVEKTKADTDRDTAYVQAQTEGNRIDHELRMAELQMRERLAMLDYANKREMSLEDVKAQLAQTTMKLQAQIKLAADGSAPQVATPAMEPPGRAPDGQAFQR